jgi:hypothetical protein
MAARKAELGPRRARRAGRAGGRWRAHHTRPRQPDGREGGGEGVGASAARRRSRDAAPPRPSARGWAGTDRAGKKGRGGREREGRRGGGRGSPRPGRGAGVGRAGGGQGSGVRWEEGSCAGGRGEERETVLGVWAMTGGPHQAGRRRRRCNRPRAAREGSGVASWAARGWAARGEASWAARGKGRPARPDGQLGRA